MPNPSKCISTAEMFFLKTSISAEWHTSDLVWLRQKGSLLVLHPFFRYCIKFQSRTRAYIQTHSPPHQIHELIVLKSYAPVVKLPAVKSSRFWYVKQADFQHGGRSKLQLAFLPLRIPCLREKQERFYDPSVSINSCRFLFIAGAGIELFMMKVRVGKETFCK